MDFKPIKARCAQNNLNENSSSPKESMDSKPIKARCAQNNLNKNSPSPKESQVLKSIKARCAQKKTPFLKGAILKIGREVS